MSAFGCPQCEGYGIEPDDETKNKNVVALLRAASLLIRHCNINNIAVCNVNTDFIADLSRAVDAAEDFFDPWITDEELLAWQDE